MALGQESAALSREQKTGFVLLLLFGIVTIGLGFFQMRNTIYNPFAPDLESNIAPVVTLDEETKLQQIDTDRDGLNDYEELKFFQTSPYLADTDSDGESDKTEIDAGKDPLCPEGKLCTTQTDLPAATSTGIVSPLLNTGTGPLDILSSLGADLAPTTSASLGIDMDALNDPAYIRSLLLQTGKMKKEELDKIDDATILKMVKDLLASQQAVPPKQ